MENKIDNQLVKRIKSLLWRASMMGIAFIVSVLAENLVGLGLSPWITTVLGLALGELSKYLNTKTVIQ